MQYLSPEGLEKLKKEIEERKTIKRQEIAQRLEEAKSLGDLSENTEYSTAKEDQAFNESRILELEELIKEASIITSDGRSKKEVQIGAVVEAKMMGEGNGKKFFFNIVGSHEANPSQGKISNESPLGRALLNKKAGDIIEAETPKGSVRYKIINIK